VIPFWQKIQKPGKRAAESGKKPPNGPFLPKNSILLQIPPHTSYHKPVKKAIEKRTFSVKIYCFLDMGKGPKGNGWEWPCPIPAGKRICEK
jgi:hypothetical protein